MSNIFLYGVPGVGKSYLSKKLGKILGYPVIQGDLIKRRLRKNNSPTTAPFLFSSTCRAYTHFGSLNQHHAIQGLRAVRQALVEAVLLETQAKPNAIFESAFIDPQRLPQNSRIVLITLANEQKHKWQFFSHPEKFFHKDEYRAARIIQTFLITEAKSLQVSIFENDNKPISSLVDLINV